MRQFRPVLMTSVSLGAAAAALWACVAAHLGGAADRDSNALLAVAITVTLLAAACAAAGWARQASDGRRQAMSEAVQALADAVQEDRALLIRTLSAVSPRKAGVPTAPIRAR